MTSAPQAKRAVTRVLVLTSTFPRWAGDTEPRFVLDLCRHLAAAAVDVRVLAPHTAGAALEEALEGVHVRRFRYFFPALQSLAYSAASLQATCQPAATVAVAVLLRGGRAVRCAGRRASGRPMSFMRTGSSRKVSSRRSRAHTEYHCSARATAATSGRFRGQSSVD